MHLSARHYHSFGTGHLKDGKLDSPESWDALRAEDPHFSIPESREEWVLVSEGKVKKDGQDGRIAERGEAVAALLAEKGITTLVSVGAGGAGLEYQVKKRIPALTLIITEYAPETVARLRSVFTEADDVRSFDLLKDSWDVVRARPDAATTAVLMYRLDAGFTDTEWKEVFERLSNEGVQNILYIPTGFLTLRSLLSRTLRRWLRSLKGERFSFAGYLRSKEVFSSFWEGKYDASEQEFAGLSGFWLGRRG